MDKEQLLAQLRDAHLPPEPSWWPLAIGWWILMAIALLLISYAIFKLIQKKRYFRFSRFAHQELDYLISSDNQNWLILLEVLLRRVALSYFPAIDVARLSQQEWIDFLVQTGDNHWTEQPLICLRDVSFCDPSTVDPIHKQLLFSQSRIWISNIPNIAKHGVSLSASAKDKPQQAEVTDV